MFLLHLPRWHHSQANGQITEQEDLASSLHGFAAISRRHTSCKPIIAAVNGSAYGGGVELILNCDIVIASEDAVFALPEVKRGVLAAQGGTSLVLMVLSQPACCGTGWLAAILIFPKRSISPSHSQISKDSWSSGMTHTQTSLHTQNVV